MRILTVRQPWAWAIINAGKDVENRQTNVAGTYRGRVAIHAGKSLSELPEAAYRIAQLTGAMPLLFQPSQRGAIIGIVDLIDVHQRTNSRTGATQCNGDGICSQWAESHAIHLVLANPKPLLEPIPYRGMLGLRTLDDQTTARIEAAII